MVAAQARPAYIYDTTLGDWVPMSGVVDTGQAYTFTANQTFSGLVTANNGINAATTLSLQTGGTNRLSIDSSGRVFKPSQPSWHLAPSGNGTITGNVPSIIPFQSANGVGVFANGVSVSSGRVTVPVSGKYLVMTSWRQENVQTYYQIQILKNGVSVYRGGIWNTSQNYETVHGNAILNLSANDYLEIEINPGATLTYTGYTDTLTWFSGWLLG
jgi:hypothetical protein